MNPKTYWGLSTKHYLLYGLAITLAPGVVVCETSSCKAGHRSEEQKCPLYWPGLAAGPYTPVFGLHPYFTSVMPCCQGITLHLISIFEQCITQHNGLGDYVTLHLLSGSEKNHYGCCCIELELYPHAGPGSFRQSGGCTIWNNSAKSLYIGLHCCSWASPSIILLCIALPWAFPRFKVAVMRLACQVLLLKKCTHFIRTPTKL